MGRGNWVNGNRKSWRPIGREAYSMRPLNEVERVDWGSFGREELVREAERRGLIGRNPREIADKRFIHKVEEEGLEKEIFFPEECDKFKKYMVGRPQGAILHYASVNGLLGLSEQELESRAPELYSILMKREGLRNRFFRGQGRGRMC